MPPRQQRSFQQQQQQQPSASAGVNPFPVYRPPVAGPSSSGPAGAFAGRRRSPSPDDPGRLDRFVVTAYEADLVRGQPELSLQLEQRRGEGEAKQGRLVRCAVASATGGHDDDGDDTGLWVDRSVLVSAADRMELLQARKMGSAEAMIAAKVTTRSTC